MTNVEAINAQHLKNARTTIITIKRRPNLPKEARKVA
jgi:hypothetical protein